MYLEIPDSETIVEDPAPEHITSALESLDCGEMSDSCVDLCAGSLTYLQAIGCPEKGFVVEFQLGSTDQHYRSRRVLPFDTTARILSLYAAGDERWRDLFDYSWVDVSERGRAPENPIRGFIRAIRELIFGGP